MNHKTTILLIDDDAALGEMLEAYLQRFDLLLVSATHPEEGLELLESVQPQLVILDIMLPQIDGLEVCRRIRQHSEIPIVMLTARGDVMDRIVGLELGADDYMPKPFEPRELVVRIQNILRRSHRKTTSAEVIRKGDLTIDPNSHEVRIQDETVELSTTEYELLLLLATSPGKVFSRDEIMNRLKGIEAEIFSRSVDIAISRLRQKLKDTEKPPRYIRTVWGSGYAFVEGGGNAVSGH